MILIAFVHHHLTARRTPKKKKNEFVSQITVVGTDMSVCAVACGRWI